LGEKNLIQGYGRSSVLYEAAGILGGNQRHNAPEDPLAGVEIVGVVLSGVDETRRRTGVLIDAKAGVKRRVFVVGLEEMTVPDVGVAGGVVALVGVCGIAVVAVELPAG